MRRAIIIAAIVLVVVAGVFVFANRSGSGSSNGTDSGSVAPGQNAGTPGAGDAKQPDAEQPGVASDAGDSAEDTASAEGDAPSRNTPVEAGEPLGKVTEPPSATLAFVSEKGERAKATYTFRFQPFGEGPQIAGDRTLVVLVTRSRPSGAAPGSRDYASSHLLLRPRPQMWEKLARGGTYEGDIVFREQQQGLSPYLESLKTPKAPQPTTP
ncbi:MAG TPA: hypothetical protein VFG89_00065 [Coriobacteriia bacterium]|nr:hypothetical protein [Coriobacteriia bacterium]